MKEHIVIDDFLSSTYHKEIEAHLTSFNFEWYYQSNITDTEKSAMITMIQVDTFNFWSLVITHLQNAAVKASSGSTYVFSRS